VATGLPVVELNGITPEHYLDGLESAVTESRLGSDAPVAGGAMASDGRLVGWPISAGATWSDIGGWVRLLECGQSVGGSAFAASGVLPAWG